MPSLLQLWTVNFEQPDDPLPAITLLYLPLNHIAGHIQLLKAFCRGGVNYFVRATDMSTLLEAGHAAHTPTPLMLAPSCASISSHAF